MSISRTTAPLAVVTMALTLLLLSGCAADQSTTVACETVRDGLASLQSDLTENLSSFEDDPEAAVEAIDAIAETFATNVDGVTNTEVKTAAEITEDKLNTLAEEFAAYVDDPEGTDGEALTATATDLQTSFTTLEAVCF